MAERFPSQSGQKDAPDTNLDSELFLCTFLPHLHFQFLNIPVDHPSPNLALQMLNCAIAGSDFRLAKYICSCMTNLH